MTFSSGKSELMIDLSGRIVFAGTYFCDLIGIDYDKIEGRSCFDFFFPEELDEAKELFELIKNPNGEPFRFRLRSADGKPVWVDIQGLAMKESHTSYAISAIVTPDDQTA